MLERVKGVPREVAALLVLGVLLVAAAAYLYSQRSEVEGEIVVIDARRVAAEVERESLSQELSAKTQEVQEKRQELEAKQAEVRDGGGASKPAALASRREAVELSGQLIAATEERGLNLSKFDTQQTAITLAETEFPALSFSLAASGRPDDLIGLLDVVEAVPTARIDTLELARDEIDAELWRLTAAIIVVYQQEG